MRKVWKWCGLGAVYDESDTYTQIDYADEDFTLLPQLEGVKTLPDLERVLKTTLADKEKSPMGCKYDFEMKQDNIFYRDNVEAMFWALEPETGYVYMHDVRALKRYNTRFYVAKSLGHFVSRILEENEQWDQITARWIVESKPSAAKHRMRSPPGRWA
jgi:hypothetical protein